MPAPVNDSPEARLCRRWCNSSRKVECRLDYDELVPVYHNQVLVRSEGKVQQTIAVQPFWKDKEVALYQACVRKSVEVHAADPPMVVEEDKP